MTGTGAYEGEMADLALFESALRAAVPKRPDPRIGADLVPRLAEIARTASVAAANGTPVMEPAPRRRRRLTLVARVGIAAATIPLLFAGLAIAGVTVPQAASDAFEAVGVELPNQPAGNEDARGGTKDGAPGTSEDPGAPATGKLPSEASPKATPNRKANGLDEHKPGRRVRRHGQGPPGPASPPEGRALGLANKEAAGSGASGASQGKGDASAQAGSGNSGGGPPAGRGKP